MCSIGISASESSETKLCRSSRGVHSRGSSPAASTTLRKERPREPTVTRRWPQVTPDGTSGLSRRRRCVARRAALAPASGLGEAPAGARRPDAQATADQPDSPGDAAGYSTGRLPRCVIVLLPVAASRPSFRRRMRSAAPNPSPLARVAAPTRKAGKVNGPVSAPGGRSVFPPLARRSGRVAHPSHPRICRCRR